MNQPTELFKALKRTIPPELLVQLQGRFLNGLSTTQAVRDHHGQDESPYLPSAPEAVVFAQSLADIVDLVNLCREHQYPIIPYGAGSSIEGHFLAIQGGVCLDVSRMNQVISINAEDLTATVQPGVTRKQLNTELNGTGLSFQLTRVPMLHWAV